MKPDDVPDELVEAFDLHSYAGPGDATPWTPSAAYASEQAYIRNGLAAVLPAHEAMVRAKVAAKMEETWKLWSQEEPPGPNGCRDADVHNCHRVAGELSFAEADRIARGDS